MNCTPASVKVSPDGELALCASRSGNLNLSKVSGSKFLKIVSSSVEDNANETSFDWIDNNRFGALIVDKSCPYAHLYDFFPSRLVVFDRRGRRLSLGVCAFGIVGGAGRIALMGERHNSILWKIREAIADDPRYFNDGYDSYHHTWSIDNGRSGTMVVR